MSLDSIGCGIRLDVVFDWLWYSIGCGIRLDVVFDWMWYSIGCGIRLDVVFDWKCSLTGYGINIRLEVVFDWIEAASDDIGYRSSPLTSLNVCLT